jgi:signal transduction histidine kinase
MISPLSFGLPLAFFRAVNEVKDTLLQKIKQHATSLRRFAHRHRFIKSRRKATRSVEAAFIDFIINTAANSNFGNELRWQIENFKSKNRRQQSKLFPGFYLYVERYIFNSLETSKYAFREVLYQQFQMAIDQNLALKIIFLEPEKQTLAIYRRFLYSVARKSQRYQKLSEVGHDLQLWLDGKNSFTSFSKFTRKEGAELLVHISHDFFAALCSQGSDRLALKVFNDAYEKQSLRYQNLESFHEVLKLFPGHALDETKYNLLSIQEMKILLAEKVEKLETLSAELHEKNNLLEQSYDEVLTQSEQLNLQNHQLEEAQQLIHMMNDELTSYSLNLEIKVQERTRELAHKNELLTHYNNNLEQYTFAISHQLKAPITRILGLTNLLKLVPAHEQAVIAGSVQKSAKELDGIFKDLVHSLNFKKEVAELKTERVGVSELLMDTWKKVAKNHEKELAIEWKIMDDASVETDPNHLSNALTHIFDNAVKFHKPGDAPRITAEVKMTEGQLEISIHDEGIGFDWHEMKSKLFTPFQRFNQTHTGRGMGLYFTKQHLSLLGGDIKIASEVNNGTKVKIELPVAQ